jgi:hypothetical protein
MQRGTLEKQRKYHWLLRWDGARGSVSEALPGESSPISIRECLAFSPHIRVQSQLGRFLREEPISGGQGPA